MLKFNTLLKESGIDPKDVQLVRHKDRGPTGTTPYSLMCEPSWDRFILYQRIQKPKTFSRKLIASFVVTPFSETLFANLYLVGSPQRNSSPQICPVRKKVFETGRCWMYSLSQDNRMIDFSQRLIIEWGRGYRKWVQKADRQDKTVLEIRSRFIEPVFPPYLEFERQIAEIPNLFPTWRTVLTRTKGVYLLVDQATGGQYVGSATGDQGFFGRWLAYARDGHGGNTMLKQLNHRNYVVSILETAGSAMDRNDILQREAFWKEKLGSRAKRLGDEYGLNAN